MLPSSVLYKLFVHEFKLAQCFFYAQQIKNKWEIL